MKKIFYVMIAIIAIALSACRTGDYPANMQGNWLYDDTTNYVISTFSVSSSNASKGIPATIEVVFLNQEKYPDLQGEYADEVLVDYDPSDGYGSFKPKKGEEGLQGEFEALDKEDIELSLFLVDKKGTKRELLHDAVYTLKKEAVVVNQ